MHEHLIHPAEDCPPPGGFCRTHELNILLLAALYAVSRVLSRSLAFNESLRDVLEICTPRLLGAGVIVDWQPAATLPPIIGRPLQLRMLFKALVDNAIEAMNIKGWKRRELSLTSAVERDCVVIAVMDTGPGIPPDWRHKAFEPFFTAKTGVGKHIGTGLSRAQQVVADHGGIIDLEESPSGGCRAVVEFRLDGDPI